MQYDKNSSEGWEIALAENQQNLLGMEIFTGPQMYGHHRSLYAMNFPEIKLLFRRK